MADAQAGTQIAVILTGIALQADPNPDFGIDFGGTVIATAEIPKGWSVGNRPGSATFTQFPRFSTSPAEFTAAVSVPSTAALGDYTVSCFIDNVAYEGSFSVIAYSTQCANSGSCCPSVA